MEDLINYIFIPIGVLILFFIVVRNKHVIAFKERNIKLFNVLKVLALLYLFYQAVKTGKSYNYSFAIFYGLLAMYDTYMQEKKKKEKNDKA
jgi:hypothetical protein